MPVAFTEEIDELPQLADFTLHKTLRDVDFDGVAVTGLDADFYRRPVGDPLLSVGVYRFAGAETHRAWGWVGAAHCSWHAYRDPASAGFDGPHPGCPDLRVLLAEGRPYGFDLGVGDRRRRFLLRHGPLVARGAPRVDDRGDAHRQADRQPGALEDV